jgi:metal-responsive CopG/Arc/MetJ family transcriptional regulator
METTQTTFTLSDDLLEQVDALSKSESRSDFVERALWKYVAYLNPSARVARNLHERKLLDEHADSLNAESSQVSELLATL